LKKLKKNRRKKDSDRKEDKGTSEEKEEGGFGKKRCRRRKLCFLFLSALSLRTLFKTGSNLSSSFRSFEFRS
jgi:hypothetical protein